MSNTSRVGPESVAAEERESESEDKFVCKLSQPEITVVQLILPLINCWLAEVGKTTVSVTIDVDSISAPLAGEELVTVVGKANSVHVTPESVAVPYVMLENMSVALVTLLFIDGVTLSCFVAVIPAVNVGITVLTTGSTNEAFSIVSLSDMLDGVFSLISDAFFTSAIMVVGTVEVFVRRTGVSFRLTGDVSVP